ncbi:unnamed protein product [Adineta steineri]|uniref:Uncharacterized protein n=1 Tax=Adineta steineri TaxID=433720 RepID=A0A819LXI5_9BILA|nr:unnamed protein product [Adineta steineri]
MSTISKYELLKHEGTWFDRIKYILSLSDKNEIEKYLKQSTSYEDLQILIFLSKLTKNEKNLLEIFQNDSLPVRRRIIAGKAWLKIQNDENQIHKFIVETINDKNISRLTKQHLLKSLCQIDCLKKSSIFFYNLACYLTGFYRYDQYNLDQYLLPFCSQDQILDLLSRWSIDLIKQMSDSSFLLYRSKLMSYHPQIFLHLIQRDLTKNKITSENFSKYYSENTTLFTILTEKDPKAVCRLTIECVNQLEINERFLPYFIVSKQKYFFKKAPDEMIELITIVASTQSGTIKYQLSWCSDKPDLDKFLFPRSFSLEHYIRLFDALYNTCKWSTNHTIRLFQYMLQDSNQHVGLHSNRKCRKWLLNIVIHERIGKELFIEKLLNEGDETTLELFAEYAEITTPLSLHLISRYEIDQNLKTKKRLSLIRYQLMTKDIFDQFIILFNQTSSTAQQREQNYLLFLQCAFSTNDEQVKHVLEWIEKKFTNEQINIIHTFLSSLSQYNNKFQLEILPKNLEIIEAIIDHALNHLQKSSTTLQTITSYGLLLLQRAEHHPNKEQREQIQQFACKIIKRCFSVDDKLTFYVEPLSEAYPIARNLIANILISNMFSKLLSKCMLDELIYSINQYLKKPWRIVQIDTFINSFFMDYLPSSIKLQSIFKIDKHSSLISLYLKQRLTQFERVNQLINKIDKIFFFHETVQQIAFRSQQYRSLIDKLIEDNKCITLEKLSNEETQYATNLETKTKNMKLPGLYVDILSSSFYHLTGKQQQHITNIILYDYIQDKEVSNLMKLKSLRVLHYLTHTSNESLQWLDQKQIAYGLTKDHHHHQSTTNRRGLQAITISCQSVELVKDNTIKNIDPLDNIIICVPVTFDLNSQDLLKQFHILKIKLNASNAKYISDAMLTISRRIPADIFLQHYIELVRSEQLTKLGITSNKEIIRLLNEYASDSNLITSVIRPLWDSRPHPDIRACLILTLLQFIDKVHSNDDKIIIWKILEEAADDNYLPVVQTLFPEYRGSSRWPLSRSIYSSDDTFELFINRIQFKVLDHPTSLEARLWAWTNINYKKYNSERLIEKSKQLCVQFDKNANILWETAFNQLILCYKHHQISLIDPIIDIIKNLMLHRDEIDSKENAINNQQDLPIYHRVQRILIKLISYMKQLSNEEKLPLRSFAIMIFQFDKTFALLTGTLLINTAQNRDDLESMLVLFQENLSEYYYERIIEQLGNILYKSCHFIQQLSAIERFDLAQWFINEKDQGLFVFALLKKNVFSQSGVDREQCQNLLRQLRKSENLLLRQQALGYTVNWAKKKQKLIKQQRDRIAVSNHPS